jgi:hypothetical protein
MESAGFGVFLLLVGKRTPDPWRNVRKPAGIVKSHRLVPALVFTGGYLKATFGARRG